MKKVILGGLLGGFVLFVWGAVSHMLLPLGEAGVRSMPPSAVDHAVGWFLAGLALARVCRQ